MLLYLIGNDSDIWRVVISWIAMTRPGVHLVAMVKSGYILLLVLNVPHNTPLEKVNATKDVFVKNMFKKLHRQLRKNRASMYLYWMGFV